MAANNILFWNKASEDSISTDIGLLITNIIIVSRLDATLLVNVSTNVKIKKKSNDWIYLHRLERSCLTLPLIFRPPLRPYSGSKLTVEHRAPFSGLPLGCTTVKASAKLWRNTSQTTSGLSSKTSPNSWRNVAKTSVVATGGVDLTHFLSFCKSLTDCLFVFLVLFYYAQRL